MRALLVGVLLTIVSTACGDDGPTADEQRVCSAVQKIVDDLAAGRDEAAVATLSELEQAATSTANERMSAAGAEFFAVLRTTADRFQLTISEVAELGERFHAESTRHLDVIVDECGEAGAPIDRLPTA